MNPEWMAKVEEMLENLHLRLKEAGAANDELRNKVKLLEISVETHRTTITILAGRHRNGSN